MNLKRYSVAGGISLAVHAAFLVVAQEPKVFAMPAGNQTTSVSINFTSQPAPKVAEVTPPAEQPAETAPEPTPEPPPVKEPPKPKKPKPEVKKEKPVKKPVEKKPPVKKEVQKKPKTTETKPEPKQVVKEKPVKHEKPTPDQEVSESKPTPSSQGVTAQPVMVERPSFLSRPTPPKYPRLARKRGIEGVATYEIWLDENGKQVKQVLVSSSGVTMLDKSALDAIKKWKFSPHTVDGVKMAHRVQIPVRFKLDR